MNTTHENQHLATLLEERVRAKRLEDAAIVIRRGIDGQIADILRDAKKPEGSVTQKAGDLKATVAYGVTRSVDTEMLQAAWDELPGSVRAVFRFKAEVSVAPLKALEGALAAKASPFITSKPASPSVTVAIA